MKKTIVIFSILALSLCSNVNARQEGIHEAGTGLENPETKETNQGAGQGLTSEVEEDQAENTNQIQQSNHNSDSAQDSGGAIQAQNQETTQTQNQGEESQNQIQVETKAKNSQELKEMIQGKKEELKKEAEGKKEKVKSTYQNQNKVREAVHAMLAMENVIGGIGQQVSEIAKEFNNSVEKTIQAEEKIQTKNRVWKFFFGGDQKSASQLDQEVGQNQEKLKELKQLQTQCNCDNEIKEILNEQVKNIEKEQERLQELVLKEKQNKGLFGTILNWFK